MFYRPAEATALLRSSTASAKTRTSTSSSSSSGGVATHTIGLSHSHSGSSSSSGDVDYKAAHSVDSLADAKAGSYISHSALVHKGHGSDTSSSSSSSGGGGGGGSSSSSSRYSAHAVSADAKNASVSAGEQKY
jgi:hypothetical protein